MKPLNNFSSPKFDYLVFIGRFQPFHIGHKQVIDTALSMADKVIVLIGSAQQPRTIKNPWTAHERMGMIFDGLDLPKQSRVVAVPVRDHMYNDQKWAAGVVEAVQSIVRVDCVKDAKIGIIGHTKDESSYYLKMFPQWKQVEHSMNEVVSATDLRGIYFEGKNIKFLRGLLPEGVYDYLDRFRTTDHYKLLQKEYTFIQSYKKGWEVAPYPPTFITVDAVVVQSGHVLLVQRKAAPGEGLWALPGGFVNQKEKLEDAVLRELREETKLKVPAPVLRGSIRTMRVFDHPDRSLRGRTITNAYLIELSPGELPPVKGSDDAKAAKWVPICDVSSEEMFEDHYSIIENLLGRV